MSHCPTCAIIVSVVRLKTTSGGSRRDTERSRATGGERLAEPSTTGGSQTESWSYQTMWTTDARIAGKSHLKIMSGLRKFIAVDSYTSVKIGDLQKEMRSKEVVRPRFTADFPGAVFREGADKLTLRTHGESVFAHLH